MRFLVFKLLWRALLRCVMRFVIGQSSAVYQ